VRCAQKPMLIADFERASAIFRKYVDKKGSHRIKISPSIAKTIRKAFRGMYDKNISITTSVFDEARDAILKNLEKDQLPRFMKSMFYITMYNSITSRKAYELPEQVFKEFLIAAEGGEEDGWVYVNETKGILIHKKQFVGEEFVCVRGSGVIPLPIGELHSFIKSIKLRQYWDFKCTGRVIERFDDKTIVAQYEFGAPKWAPMFNDQDFVIIRTEQILSDGTIIVISRSIIHKDAPPRKGYTRSEVECSGFVLRPCGNNATVCIYVSQAKMNGIPKWAESMLCNKRALHPYKIRKFIEKELKDKKKVPIWRSDNLW